MGGGELGGGGGGGERGILFYCLKPRLNKSSSLFQKPQWGYMKEHQ